MASTDLNIRIIYKNIEVDVHVSWMLFEVGRQNHGQKQAMVNEQANSAKKAKDLNWRCIREIVLMLTGAH